MSRLRSRAPAMSIETGYWKDGCVAVAGADEVGKGAWAGPISVGVVVIPTNHRLKGVRDSKLLSPSRRERLYHQIADWALGWAVGSASSHECDQMGMSAAHKLAAARALDQLPMVPDALLADGKWNFINADQMVVKGDRKSLAIAAASVLAKVTRDREMAALAKTYPWYCFESNKGYPSPSHRAALAIYGPSPIHRTSWGWVAGLPFQVPGRQGRLFL